MNTWLLLFLMFGLGGLALSFGFFDSVSRYLRGEASLTRIALLVILSLLFIFAGWLAGPWYAVMSLVSLIVYPTSFIISRMGSYNRIK